MTADFASSCNSCSSGSVMAARLVFTLHVLPNFCSLFLVAELFRKWTQTNKAPPPPPPADAAEGPIHMQIIIDLHSARQSGEHEYGSQHPTSFSSNQTAPSAENKGCMFMCCRVASSRRVFVVYRSARAEAGRPDPAQTESHCGDHLHTGGGQTKRGQVNDKVGDVRWEEVSCVLLYVARAPARGGFLNIDVS